MQYFVGGVGVVFECDVVYLYVWIWYDLYVDCYGMVGVVVGWDWVDFGEGVVDVGQ